MKFYAPSLIVKMAVLACWVITLCGCEGKPERKKLPDFTSLQGWEDMPLPQEEQQPFFTSDTTIMEGSRLKNFLSVAMPDPKYDSLAISMVTTYEPFAATLIEKWAKQYKKGVLIDLRTQAGNDNQRADFLVKENLPGNTNINIPVIFIWDRPSAYRFDYLVNVLNAVPGIKCNLISESRAADGVGRNDCFSPTEPSLDE